MAANLDCHVLALTRSRIRRFKAFRDSLSPAEQESLDCFLLEVGLLVKARAPQAPVFFGPDSVAELVMAAFEQPDHTWTLLRKGHL